MFLAEWFPRGTWANWKTVIKAAHGLPLDEDELAFFHTLCRRGPATGNLMKTWAAIKDVTA
jgi:hypothetical protein